MGLALGALAVLASSFPALAQQGEHGERLGTPAVEVDTPSATPSPPPSSPDDPPTAFSGVFAGGVVADKKPARTEALKALPEDERRPWSTQRRFALLAVALAYDGFGLGVRGLGPRFGLDLSAAVHPVFATHGTDPQKFPKLRLLEGYQLNASIYLALHRAGRYSDIGLSLGYKYNTLIRHGVGVAFYWQREFAAHWALLIFAGPAVFPRAEAKIRAETGWTGGSVSSGLAFMQGGLGASLAFYP